MQFSGLLKLTLLDYPGKVACTLFVSNCNYRCPFCHNSDLVFNKVTDSYSQEQIIKFLKTRIGILDGVCITGGEPTMQSQLTAFIKQVKEMGFLVKLDTNGTNPKMLKQIAQDKLIDYVAMDIKSSPQGYALAAGVANPQIEKIKESVEFLKSDVLDGEFRTTAVKELIKLSDFELIANWLKGTKPYFLQSFLDSGKNIQDGLTGYLKEELILIKDKLNNIGLTTYIRGI